jgi:hypothetical protein
MNAFDVGIDLTLVPMLVGREVRPCSFSQKIPQYIACGLPVMCWDVEGNGFIDDEGLGVLVRPECGRGSMRTALKEVMTLVSVLTHERRAEIRQYVARYLSTEVLANRRVENWMCALEELG